MSCCSRISSFRISSCDDLIERRGDLVADDELGLGGKRAGDADALLLAARQLARQAVDQALVELDQVEQLADLAVAGARRSARDRTRADGR